MQYTSSRVIKSRKKRLTCSFSGRCYLQYIFRYSYHQIAGLMFYYEVLFLHGREWDPWRLVGKLSTSIKELPLSPFLFCRKRGIPGHKLPTVRCTRMAVKRAQRTLAGRTQIQVTRMFLVKVATDFPQKLRFREIPLFQVNPCWWNMIPFGSVWPDLTSFDTATYSEEYWTAAKFFSRYIFFKGKLGWDPIFLDQKNRTSGIKRIF